MKTTRSDFLPVLMSLLMAASALGRQASPDEPLPASTSLTPLEEALNPDGTLAASDLNGSFDPRGWRMVAGPKGQPRFVRAGSLNTAAVRSAAKPENVAANGKWDDRFLLNTPGVTGGNEVVNAIAVSGNVVYVGGNFDTAGNVSANNVAMWNGHKWSALGDGVDETVLCLALNGATLYVGGNFTHAGGTNASHIARWNGVGWSALGTGTSGGVQAIAVNGKYVYAGGSFGAAGGVGVNCIGQWDGNKWSALGQGVSGIPLDQWSSGYEPPVVNAIAVSGGNVYVGGFFNKAGGDYARNFSIWNGSKWTWHGDGPSTGPSDVNSSVWDIVIRGRQCYVAGYFNVTINSVGLLNIAVFDTISHTWSALGGGVGSDNYDSVWSLGVSPDGDVYAYYFNGWSSSGFMKWNGNSWTNVAGADDLGDIWAIGFSGSDMYIGGSTYNEDYNNVAEWDGKSWKGLRGGAGQGLDSPVGTIAVSGSGVYAGGSFQTAGNTSASGIAKWNGSGWSALGGGVDGEVSAVAVNGTDVYAGGGFMIDGGSNAICIARWNGSAWSALGGGVNAPVNAFALSGGILYAGGDFTTAGGSNANYIAKWDGNSWSALGGGVNAPVNALAAIDVNVYAGGYFWTRGSDSSFLAKWNGANWVSVGGGVDGPVNAVVMSGNNLYVGGDFMDAGGVESARFGIWQGHLGPSPDLAITSYSDSQVVNTSVITLAGTASDASHGDYGIASVKVNGARAANDTAGGAGTAGWSRVVNLKPGSNTITVVATDGKGNSITNVIHIISDTSPPGLVITTPKPNSRVSNAVVTVTGTASDSAGVSSVWCQINSNAWTLASGTANWTAALAPTAGANTLRAYAVDPCTNFSSTNSISFNYIPSATLAVNTIGSGTVAPKDDGKLLAIGTNYTLTALPGKNWIFSNWVASGSENFVSNNPVLKFNMQPNLTLTANFVTNVFLAAQGTYNGLFAPANPPRQQTNSGAISFTLTSAGVVSGKLTLGTNTPSLNGQFDPSGAATIITPRKGLSNLITTLQLDFAGQTASGSITDGSFVALLMADLEQKATHYEGQYTLIIPGTDEQAAGPLGTSCGTVTVKSGAISFGGYLADGTIVNQSSYVSTDGYWPFYLSLYGGNGSFWSWNSFTNTNGAMIIFSTNASWINATNTSKTALYRTGFTNQAASIIGSAYHATDKPLLALTSGQVTLEGGNLPVAITNTFILTSKNAIILTNAGDTNKLTLTINKSTGVISGGFANPSNLKQTIKVNGVLFQNQTNAQGYFLGTNQSGTFMLMPQ